MNELLLPASAAKRAAPSSWLASAALRFFGRRGAWAGLVWVGVLALAAVFSPFIATSFPYVWHEGGQTSYPVLAHLGPADVVLLLAFLFTAVLACFRRAPVLPRLGLWLWLVLAAIPAAGWKVWWSAAKQQAPVDFADGLVRSEQMTVAFYAGWLVAGVVLLAALALLFFFSKAGRGAKAAALAAALAMGVFFALRPVHPPENFDFSHYRVTQKAGKGEGVFAPIPYSPQDIQADLGKTAYAVPSRSHWMGADANGCDLASRMLHACRVSLSVGLISTVIALFIGVVVGGLMGYFSGMADLLGMRLVEIFSAIPVLPILIMICSFYERNIYLIMVILGLFGWVGYAVFIRAEFLRLRKTDYVEAARSVGASTGRIMVRHMLPSGITPLLTLAPFGVAGAIMMESSLSFLGLGLKPENPSWGQNFEMAVKAGPEKWWLIIFPCAAVFLTVFAYNLVGEALRDALDPKLSK